MSLAEVASPELRPFVKDPSLLRIADDEIADPRFEAPVLVESDKEFDLIMGHLVKSGMLERKIEYVACSEPQRVEAG